MADPDSPLSRLEPHAHEHDEHEQDWHAPLENPRWVGAAEALHMQPEDPVLGLEFEGRSWALPWWIMKNHHMANLVLDERPVFVAFCEACGTAGAFDPVIDGRRHTFRLFGFYNGSIVARDDQTGSLWPAPAGRAIRGPLQGRSLERLPLLQCTWREWIELHSDTVVPDGTGESRTGHGEGHAPGAPSVDAGMVRALLRRSDRRLPHYELVLGVQVNGQSRCYPLAALERYGSALNDTLGGEEIVVFCRPGSWMASAFRRNLGGKRLTFRTEGDAIVDEQTGSRWEVSGTAVDGPLRGSRLPYVFSGVEEFYIWAAFHPETGIFGADSPVGTPGWSLEMLAALARIVLGEQVRAQPPRFGQWWHRGMRLLDTGSGEGVIAAWFAAAGLEVLGVDPSPEQVERARRSFRAVPRLRFEVADIRSAPPAAQFDALIDHSVLRGLPAAERSAYLSRVAALAKPGARFLLLLPTRTASLERVAPELRRLCEPFFELVDVRPLSVPHALTGEPTQGAAFRLIRHAQR